MKKQNKIIIAVLLFTLFVLSSCPGLGDTNSLKCWLRSPAPTTDVPIDTDLEIEFDHVISLDYGTVTINGVEFEADEGFPEYGDTVWTLQSINFDDMAYAGNDIVIIVQGFTSEDDINIFMEDPKSFDYTYADYDDYD